MAAIPHIRAATEGRVVPIAIGESVAFDPFSIGGGQLGPSAIEFDVRRDGEDSVVATMAIDPMFQGPPERVHGGVVALIFDEVMGCLNRIRGQRAFTARLAVDYRAPAPIGTELTFRAWFHTIDGRKITIRGEGRGPDGPFAEAEGLFIAARPEPVLAARSPEAVGNTPAGLE